MPRGLSRRPRWVLLDRDGTINVPAAPGEYVTDAARVELLPGAGEAIAALNRAGLPVAVATNQRGVALGQMTLDDLDAVHARLHALLAERGARLDLVLACPHAEGSCDCRKPLPGLLERASRELGLPLADAVMVGDSETDVEAGRAAGTATIRLAGAAAESGADLTAPTLAHAIDAILSDRA